MVSGLFSAKTVAHLSTARATASCGHAVAVCTERPAPKTRTRPLIPRRLCIGCLPKRSSLSDKPHAERVSGCVLLSRHRGGAMASRLAAGVRILWDGPPLLLRRRYADGG